MQDAGTDLTRGFATSREKLWSAVSRASFYSVGDVKIFVAHTQLDDEWSHGRSKTSWRARLDPDEKTTNTSCTDRTNTALNRFGRQQHYTYLTAPRSAVTVNACFSVRRCCDTKREECGWGVTLLMRGKTRYLPLFVKNKVRYWLACLSTSEAQSHQLAIDELQGILV